MKLKISEN